MFQPGQQAYCVSVGTSKTANNVIFQRDPTSNDVQYDIGTFWQNSIGEKLWYLNNFTSIGSLQANWLLISFQSILASLSGSNTPSDPVFASPASGFTLPDNIQLTNLDGSMTITSDPSNHQIIFTATPSVSEIPWTDEATSFTAVVNNGYFATAALTATLPSAPTQGQVVDIAVDSSGTVIIQAASGQVIRLGNSTSSTAGTATSTAIGSSLQMVYRASNSEWFVIATQGSWILA